VDETAPLCFPNIFAVHPDCGSATRRRKGKARQVPFWQGDELDPQLICIILERERRAWLEAGVDSNRK
jgi:hypothetical protein